MRAPTPYAWTADPAMELPHAVMAVADSRDLKNSSLELADWARFQVSPKRGAKTAKEMAWL